MVRLITKDRTFSFIKLILGQQQTRKERAATNPGVPKELTATTPRGFAFGKKGGAYRVIVCLLIQSLAQLDMIYGQETRKVIADVCAYKAILNATNADTQDYFSRLVGTYDKQKKSQNANFEQYTGMGKGTGESKTKEEKRIIKPEQFATLPDIVLLNPFTGFCRVDKAPYYKEKGA